MTATIDTTPLAEAREAKNQADHTVTSLTERVRAGATDVTPAALATARQEAEFAGLRVTAAERQVEQARVELYRRQCDDLAAEMEACATDSADRFTTLLRQAETAVRAFVDAVDARNAQLNAWRQRMHQLGVPTHNNPLSPPAEHGHVGWSASELAVGSRRMRTLDPSLPLSVMLRRLQDAWRDHLGQRWQLRINLDQVMSQADPYADLARVDVALSEPPAAFFYRGTGGAVIARDTAFSAEEIKRLNLTVITRQEAWGE